MLLAFLKQLATSPSRGISQASATPPLIQRGTDVLMVQPLQLVQVLDLSSNYVALIQRGL